MADLLSKDYQFDSAVARRTQTGQPLNDLLAPNAREIELSKGLIDSFAQGATLGWSDEIRAAIVGGLSAMSGEDFGDVYRSVLQAERDGLEQFSNQRPVASTAANFAGGALSTVMAPGALLANAPLRVGAGAGALAGAGTAEEGERLQGAATGAALSAGGTAAASMGMKGLRNLRSTRAGRIVQDAIAKTGRDIKTVAQQIREMGPDARLVDVIPDLGENVAQLPGARPVIEQFLNQRAGGQKSRILGSLSSLTRSQKQFYDSLDELDHVRRQTAAPLYSRAYDDGIQWNDKLTEVVGKLKRAAPAAWRSAARLADLDGEALPDKMPAALSLKQLDWFKRGLDDVRPSMAKRPELRRAVDRLKKEMLNEADAQNPAFKAARDAWSGPTAAMHAQENGRKILSRDFELTAKEVGAMSQGEKESFVIGAVRAVRDKIIATDDSRNATKVLNPLMRERLRPAFPDDQTFELFIDTLQNENTFSMVRNQVLAGSPTARRLISAEDAANPIVEAARGNLGAAGMEMARRLTKGVLEKTAGTRRLAEDVATEIADLMIDGGSQRDLQRLLSSKGVTSEAAIMASNRIINTLAVGTIAAAEAE